MNPTVASIVCAAGIAVLIYLDRDRSLRTSPALWLPVLWLLIIGSRPVSVWLGISPDNLTVAESAEGSPLDAAVFAALGVVGVVVLLRRSRRFQACLKANWPILLFFGYCLCSVLWSDFPAIAFKRWIKAISELVMVLVIATDMDPIAALDRLIFRVGIMLMPCSVLFIRYYGSLGRGYDPDGMAMNVGVTTNKNTLGVITLVLALGCVWRFMMTWTQRQQRHRGRMLVARGTLLLFCVAVLRMAQSATSMACFGLGAIIIASTFIPAVKRKKSAIHWLTGTILICGSLIVLLGSSSLVIHALGRKSNFTGRTLIWEAVIPVVPNALLGAGFESFWLGPRLTEVYSHLSKYMHVNEAHNGYIETYLNLGCIGVALIVGILLHGYAGAVATFRRNAAFGGMALAYVISAAIYSVTEAGFRMLDPIWVFLLLAGVISYEAAFVAARKTIPAANVAKPVARSLSSAG
jgi:O-antigen ligase